MGEIPAQSKPDVTPPTCAGTDRKHRDKPMKLIGLEDDGTYIWRCPRCLYVWRERDLA